LRQKRQAQSNDEGYKCETVAQNGGMGKLQLKFRLGHGHFTSPLFAIYCCQVYIIASSTSQQRELRSPTKTSPLFGHSTQMLASSLAGADNVGFNPLYQIGAPRSIQLALKLHF
jgi:hypothetical protein